MSRGAGVSAVEVSEELARRLRGLARAVSPEEMGEIWIFPPLSEVEDSAEFLLFTRRLGDERRLVYSARLGLRAANGGPEAAAGNGTPGPRSNGSVVRGNGDPRGQEIREHGSVPSGRVHRIVDRFRRRLEDDGEPLHVVIDGRRDRWADLLGEG